MFGWWSSPPMRASLTIDWTNRGSSLTRCEWMRLMASRLVNPMGPGSLASYTTPNAPSPTWRSSWYLPNAESGPCGLAVMFFPGGTG